MQNTAVEMAMRQCGENGGKNCQLLTPLRSDNNH
jgi:hypothetical protein